jgi:hypothetical protein
MHETISCDLVFDNRQNILKISAISYWKNKPFSEKTENVCLFVGPTNQNSAHRSKRKDQELISRREEQIVKIKRAMV